MLPFTKLPIKALSIVLLLPAALVLKIVFHPLLLHTEWRPFDSDRRTTTVHVRTPAHVSVNVVVADSQSKQQQQPLSSSSAASTTSTNDFGGILARPFEPWPQNRPLPCYPTGDKNWKQQQKTPTKRGFLYLKPYKTGSSTTSGVNLRMARNVARRMLLQPNNTNHTMCNARFDHGPDFTPGITLFGKRHPEQSLLWTILRHPTKRAVSQFFHMRVSRHKEEPTDRNFQSFLNNASQFPFEDYYLKALSTRQRFDRKYNDPVTVANQILDDYNFIGITERMDESFVVLMMLHNLPMADILYLSAKGKGGYDDGGGATTHGCTYIWPSFVSPGMQAYFDSDPWWQSTIHYDTLLYQAVNRSLDLTIDTVLGRQRFLDTLSNFRAAQTIVHTTCLPVAVFPCDTAGVLRHSQETDCLWKDSGCGTTCLDEVATALNLW